jgi:SAM-dependent methyltransferase
MREAPTYDAIADWYEHDYLGRWAGTDLLGINRTMGDLLGRGDGVCLEIGCGTGVRAPYVAELGYTPVGVDISAGMLAHARGRLPVVRADAGRLPFADGSVPAAVGVMVHTDLPDFPAAVREVARVLRPGGVFVHVGAHPCFAGGFAELVDDTVVVGPGYLDTDVREASWSGRGNRYTVTVRHRPMPDLLNVFPDAGLVAERFVESGSPVPVVFGVRARKP